MRLCLKLINVLFFSLFFAWQAHSAQYEFGTFDTSTCSSFILPESADAYEEQSGCVVRLKNTYETKPLVFLMPTIPSDNPDDDAPQTLALLNVTKKSFSVAQIVAPLSTLYSLSRNQMPVISYLVIEEGITTFEDGHQVLAGSVNTKRYSADGKRSSPAYERVDLSFYPSLLSGSPIVLSEVQTKNNERWLTTATKNISSMGFDLGLELTRVYKKDKDKIILKEKEKIGYLVSIPNIGETNGYDYEFSSGDIASNIGRFQPLRYTCDTLINLRQTYTTPPNFIAGKLQRQGGHGGWVRQCKKSLTQVSFVVDEDMPSWTIINQRPHIKEKVGFFAFAKKEVSPPSSNEYCELFPNVAQSHNKNSSLLYISSNAHIERDLAERYELGFKSFTDYSPYPKDKTCRNNNTFAIDTWQCVLNEALIIDPLNNLPSIIGGENKTYDASTIHFIPPGEYGNIILEPNARIKLSSGTYKIKKLELRNSAKVVIDDNDLVVIYVEDIDSQGKINVFEKNGRYELGKPESLFIFGVKADSDVTADGFNENKVSLIFRTFSEVSAYIYSKGNVKFSNNNADETALLGAVTARNLRLDSNTKLVGGGACLTPKKDKYQLKIEPSTAFSLTCDYLPVTFSVKNEDGTLANTYSGSVSVSTNITTAGKASWFPINSETPYKDVSEVADVNIKNGVGQLRLKSHDYIGNIAVKGQLNNSPSTNTVNGSYTFVPFKFGFEPSPVKVIAGKPTALKIKALACENDEATVATGYSGNKLLSISSAFLQPSTKGNGDLELKARSSYWQNQQEMFSFLNGVAEFSLRYPDAGIVDLKLADPKCSVSNGCDILPSDTLPKNFADWTQLEGSVEVHARPWTFAVCPDKQSDGTSLSGDGFVAAGDPFKVIVKPLVWQGGSEAEPIQATDELCLAKTTQNFFKLDAPIADVELSIPNTASVTPVDGKSGVLRGTVRKSYTDELEFSDLSWSEVGSVRLQADAKALYLAMTINQGYRNIGRFYPKYLELQPNRIIYPNGHDQFAYLSQPFNVQVMIKAKNALGNQVNNYNNFDWAYQADVALTAYEVPSLTSLNHRFSYHNGTDSAKKTFKGDWNREVPQTWLLARKAISGHNPTTEADGPWFKNNSRFGGYILENQDPISIRNSTSVKNDVVDIHTVAQFEETPNLRYGRMVLDDVISPYHQPVRLPLKVEYWDGSEFQTNTDDSGSTYNSNYYCKLALYPVDGSNTSILTTNITGKVSVGESDEIEAHPQLSTAANYKKQQTRFWLRIATNTPANIGCSQTNKEYQPWLTYNWRELGDEDPSAIVTFGVYRGSDRIVYRGEKGLN
ncbi:MSHA biogenesis protein MshQ [Photobacterium angustum]|uniref:MSHA biogenesis protein MshQ n=1 Tax=Photobacterium angustum TaxID=661 RepID=A0ABX5H427_PHOAN|nr:DUF6701 domain-containing protein [Photobacterium angustum]KJG36996.1 MSHA biogenesis protein MshQ [Photobacterium angustum]PSX10163.1 MSHA biogenesis protein MshQ [Photobacterium angustum]